MSATVVLAVVVGIGTWALRYVPVRLASLRGAASRRAADGRGASSPTAATPRWLGRFLAGMGVAAVAALAGSALMPYLTRTLLASDIAGALGEAVPLVAGLVGTVLAFAPRRSVAAATLVGAACYAGAWWLVSG